ncbi:MAG: serine/threonine-protein kinase [Candidatus Obscuribacterales bacterium]|nr:serine/threonine-protein kinase [Candidatus Obscuribacterales bacterium]
MNEGFDETIKSRSGLTTGHEEAFAAGQVIGGKFKVISRLGSGGMGTVYRVEQIFLKKEFALKTMDRSTGSDVMIQRFQQEAKAAFSLNHPNLVKVHDYGILDNGNPYLVMDFIDGVTFAEYLKEHGPLPIESVAPLFVQACFGLMAAHEQSVVHRDIKPANLMLLNDVRLDSEGSVKLVDFGIAKLVNREDGEIQALTRTGEIFGSPLYMSPEQCSSGTVDHRSDIYSLGCVLFEMLTGTPPHMGQNALKTMLLHQAGETPTLKEASLGKDFPESLERIVAKMLRKYPEQRYQNVGLVAHDLTVLGSENRPTLRPTRTAQKPQAVPTKVVSMTSTRLYTLLALTAVLAAVLAGSAVYFMSIGHSKSNSAVKPPVPENVQKTVTTGEVFPSPQKEEIVSQTERNAKALETVPPIEEIDVTVNGRQLHKFSFPEIGLGEIFYRRQSDSNEVYLPARGTVYAPVDTPLGLKVSGLESVAMFKSPSIFKKIPGKDFQKLMFEMPTDPKSEEAMGEEQPEAVVEKTVATALQQLNGWTNLEKVGVKCCPLNRDALNALGNFKKMRVLSLEHCKLDPKILAKQAFLSKLMRFNVQKCQFDNNPVISQLGGSLVLERLTVEGPISTDSLHKLQRCPELSHLQIETRHIDDGAIAEICGMKKLQEVGLLHMILTDYQIKMLSGCARLRLIALSKSLYGDNADEIKALDPRIRFVKD